MLKRLVSNLKVALGQVEERKRVLGGGERFGLVKPGAGKRCWWHRFYIPKKIMWGGRGCQ